MKYNWQILCAFWVYNLIFWYTCTLWDGHQLSWLTYHFLTYLPLFVVRTLMMSCLSKFQVCYVVLLPIVMWLYIRFPQYIHLAWLQLCTPWPISPHFPSPNPWQPCYSLLLWVLTVLDSTYNWGHRVFMSLALAYFTLYHIPSLQSCNCKWQDFLF